MQIQLNGQAVALDDSITIAELLEGHGYAGRRVAVEINRTIVPRSQHPSHRLADGDHVEIVQAMGGG